MLFSPEVNKVITGGLSCDLKKKIISEQIRQYNFYEVPNRAHSKRQKKTEKTKKYQQDIR